MNLLCADALKDRVAFVTGATRGIGLAIAKALADAGAFVVGTATSEAGAAKITEELAGRGLKRPVQAKHAAGLPLGEDPAHELGKGDVKKFYIYV